MTADVAEDDPAAALNGGALVSDSVDAGVTDQFMGFTNGRDE